MEDTLRPIFNHYSPPNETNPFPGPLLLEHINYSQNLMFMMRYTECLQNQKTIWRPKIIDVWKGLFMRTLKYF